MPAAQTRGTIESAPCPWCKKPHSFTGVADYGVHNRDPRDAAFQCKDKDGSGCGRYFVIARKQPVTLIWLERYVGDPRHPS